MEYRKILKMLKEQLNNICIIHYSCQNLGDNNEGLSPRITSIAVLRINNSIMHSFSIHLVAEKVQIQREAIESNYDFLEGEMLKNFYQFITENTDVLWLHWNMSNINYGFEAIAHRFEVLTKNQAKFIPDSKKINLSALISSKYGEDYVDHPKMQQLMQLNGGVHRDFLSGKDEVEAFKRHEFIKLHKSTMCKVYFFGKSYNLLQDGKLKTARAGFWNRFNQILESSWAKLFGLLASMFALFQLFQAAIAGFPLPK